LSLATASPTSDVEAIRASLKEQPDGVLDGVARGHAVPLRVVLDLLPGPAARAASGARFVDIWGDLVDWGPVTFIVHTDDGVFETKAPLAPGSEARGYFNIHRESPLGGHLRIARCAAIYFVDRPLFGRRSCSLQFLNIDGGAMFKVFVGRDEKRELLADQLVRFERLRDAETSTT
jgi:putative heme utilization carrier protein HutX